MHKGGDRGKILVAEDTLEAIDLIRTVLEDEGFEVIIATTGKKAIKRAELTQPDLILMDVLMPEMDGYEACRRLKASPQTQEISVIFMTALEDTEHKIRGFEAGGVDYITKPFQREELLARVEVHLQIRDLTCRLKEAKASLEQRVSERTADLAHANQKLQAEVAERQQAEIALRKSEERFRALYEDNPSMYFTLDAQGRVLSVNPFGAEQLGYTASELEGRTVLDIFFADDHEEVRQQLAVCLHHPGQVVHWELRKVHKKGHVLWVREAARAVYDRNSQPVVLVVCEDITERKRLEAQLRQAVKMEAIGNLAGGVAHDFNNLMTAVIGYSELLLQRLAEDDPMRKDLNQIHKAGKSAAVLTSQLLAFSRKQVLQPKVLDLNQAVAATENMLRRLIGEDIELLTIAESEIGRIIADPSLIEQVVINLAINARDAMPRGGKLTIETANVELDESYARQHIEVQPGRFVLLAISDTGIGMDEQIMSHIFEPFFTTKERGKGTGLGLATVYGIVKQSRGHIWVYSEPGKGSTFKIYLPQVEEEATAGESEEAGPEAIPGGSETVLLVEDDDVVRALAGRSLRINGYTVLASHVGDKAVQLSLDYHGPIHLLITDVVMPGISGPELAKRILGLRPQIKILYISGYTDNAIVHHGVLDAETSFLQKPFTPEALVRKVRAVLDTPRPA